MLTITEEEYYYLLEFKNALDDEAVICWVYNEKNKDNPRKLLKDIIDWNVQVALDPLVSAEARKLLYTPVPEDKDNLTKDGDDILDF